VGVVWPFLEGTLILFRPLPRSVTLPVSIAMLLAWVACMGMLVNREYLQASTANLAMDLARYGSQATWRGVYYRGEKIGFTVSQTVSTAEGFELQEDGRLQMSLLGATAAAAISTNARVDREFRLHAFDFSLDPGTGAIRVRGELEDADPLVLRVSITSPSGTRTEGLKLEERPVIMLNLGRQLASRGLTPGARHRWTMFDPATLRNAPVTVTIGRRELVRGGLSPVPAFRVDMAFAGLTTTAWVTDTGEVVREQSPMGLMTIREPAERARAMAVPLSVQTDLLRTSAVVPTTRYRIDETRDVQRIRLRMSGVDLPALSRDVLDGVGQSLVSDDVIEITDFKNLGPGPSDRDRDRYLKPEPFIESDAPEILAEAERAIAGLTGSRARAERLTRYVNALLEKKPTVSLPSAREVLRTKVGDCNEHTALYVAMARALGIPARISVGLTLVHGAFYYHAWPEVYIEERPGRGFWLPVDPTLNQFPADATHVRLARGGLHQQAAILPLLGRLQISVVDLDLVPSAPRVLVGLEGRHFVPLDTARSRLEPFRWRRCQ
jgi:transglutaminase-like putative cysteine protease